MEKIVTFQPASPDRALELGGPLAPPRRDWSAALDLVQEASEAIRMSEERVEELEREGQQLALRTRDELKLLASRLQAAQRDIQAAEERADLAEARALEAENWLMRLEEAITVGFGRPASQNRDL